MVTVVLLKILNIEEDGLHLLTEIFINDQSARVIVDTGASRTVFDKERVKVFSKSDPFFRQEKYSTGLGTNNMPTSTIVLEKLDIGELQIKKFDVVLLDLSHVNESYDRLGI